MASFKCNLDLQKRGLSTLFKWYRFTIDSEIHKKWNNPDDYMLTYELMVSSDLHEKVSKNVNGILKDIINNHKFQFEVTQNKGERYNEDGRTPYIYCKFDKSFLEYLKRIFISSIVYEAKNKSIPENEHETISFLFDTDNKTVTITDIHVYEPDDPYYEFARNAVYTLSVEAIGLKNYSMPGDKEKVKDFYNWDKISAWKERRELESSKNTAIDGKCGIYMLYDANSNKFYVGKAKDILTRIKQHAENINKTDPLPDFTHYRYSLINMEYYEFLYLIENAAIHDSAMILDMPKANKLNKPLVRVSSKFGKSLDDCKMANTHERQRKIEK